MNHVAVDIVGLAQTIDADPIALGNYTERVAALDHVAAARAIVGKPGALRCGPAKMPIDSVGDGRGHFTPMLGIAEVAFVLGIADETDLDQKTRYIRRAEDDEIGALHTWPMASTDASWLRMDSAARRL